MKTLNDFMTILFLLMMVYFVVLPLGRWIAGLFRSREPFVRRLFNNDLATAGVCLSCILFTCFIGYLEGINWSETPGAPLSGGPRTVFCSRVANYTMTPERGSLVLIMPETPIASVFPRGSHLQFRLVEVPKPRSLVGEIERWFEPYLFRRGTAFRRLVALPGETVTIAGSRLYINGVLLHEPYLPALKQQPQAKTTLALGPDEFLVARDARVAGKKDNFYVIRQRQIVSRVLFVVRPLREAGFAKAPQYNIGGQPQLRMSVSETTARRLLCM